MLHEFLQPCIRQTNGVLLIYGWVCCKPLFVGLSDDLFHVPMLETTKDTEEEITLRHLAR